MTGEPGKSSESLFSALCCPTQDTRKDQISAIKIDQDELYPVASSGPSHKAASSEENKDKESLRSKLEEIKAIAAKAENPNTLPTIINILQEVEKSLDSSHSINFSEINAKLDHVFNMVIVSNNIKDLLENINNSAPSTPGEVRQGEKITQDQMDRIIDMSMKLYDIFANNDALFQEIAKIFVTDEVTDEGLKDINKQKQDLREVAKKLVEAAEKTTKNNKIKEHLTETLAFITEVANSDNSTFIGAVHAAIHSAVNQRQIIELRQEAEVLRRNQEELEAKQAKQDARQAELEAKQEKLEKRIEEMTKLAEQQPATSTAEPESSAAFSRGSGGR